MILVIVIITYHDTHDMWTYNYKAYDIDDVVRVERLFVCLRKESTHLTVNGCHPKLDKSIVLGLDNYYKFQMLLEML